MSTTFLLDPRVLDDCIGDGVPDIEIAAEGLGYFVLGYAQYAVFLNSNEKQELPKKLTDLAYRKEDALLGTSLYTCSLALVTAIPIDGDWQEIKKRHKDNQHFQVLYANGFLKG